MLVKHVHNRLFLVSFDATVVTLLELHTKKFRQYAEVLQHTRCHINKKLIHHTSCCARNNKIDTQTPTNAVSRSSTL